jgi:hypothetical protein
MRTVYVALLLLTLSGTAWGQNTGVVPDTLDWKLYYPLQVGNTWEYGGLDAYTRTIVGDTLVDGRTYFIQRDSVYAVGTLGPFIQLFYVRYDTAGTVVTLLDIEADTMALPLPLEYMRTDFPDVLAQFDMSASFGDTLHHDSDGRTYYVSGGYDQPVELKDETTNADAVKCFNVSGTYLFNKCYATGIGMIRSGNLFGSRLDYALIGDIEYGRKKATSAEEAASLPDRITIEAVYPNPLTTSSARIAYRLPEHSHVTAKVFNVLGQRVWWHRTEAQAAGVGEYSIEGQDWPPGIYFIRLTDSNGGHAVQSFVVAE